jgi:hypothetical protein
MMETILRAGCKHAIHDERATAISPLEFKFAIAYLVQERVGIAP